MYQVIQHALVQPNDKTKLTFIFSNVTEADILMKETLDSWAAKYPDRQGICNLPSTLLKFVQLEGRIRYRQA